jgi:hypothetical protein
MSNPNAKFGSRAWLNAVVMAYLVNGGTITKLPQPRPRGGHVYAIIL